VEYSYKYEGWQLWIPLDALNGIKSEPKRLGEGGLLVLYHLRLTRKSGNVFERLPVFSY
jgi:hypothetical protein